MPLKPPKVLNREIMKAARPGDYVLSHYYGDTTEHIKRFETWPFACRGFGDSIWEREPEEAVLWRIKSHCEGTIMMHYKRTGMGNVIERPAVMEEIG